MGMHNRMDILKKITDYMSAHRGVTRRDILDHVCIEIKKTAPQKSAAEIKSSIGTLLNEMKDNKELCVIDGKYTLTAEQPVVVKRGACEEQILRCLKKSPMSKKELYGALCAFFGTNATQTPDDDNALRGLAGQVLRDLQEKQTIDTDGMRYILAQKTAEKTYISDEEEFCVFFLGKLCEKGGKFFERFVANLLEKYYIVKGIEVLDCDVSGGSNDGGIDVILDTLDDLGFRDHILVQAKCRRSIQTTEKEVREFFGAVNVYGGTRAIFITTATFHPAAQKLLYSIENCVGIDGNKLFALAKTVAYGFRKTARGYVLDPAVFV